MKVLYRISDNSYVKPKMENATKQRCLLNFLVQWPLEEVIVFVDKVKPETRQFLDEYADLTGLQLINIDGGSSAQSFKIVMDYALTLPDDETVLLQEDDYLHLDGSRRALLEAIERSDYVTLYDAPDKYIPASQGGNPLIDDTGSDITRVILTPSCHWRLTNSTTCTFASKVKTLREDYDVWKAGCFATPEQSHPHDFPTFLKLREQGRTLISPIPTLSTHAEPMWQAPLIDWSKV